MTDNGDGRALLRPGQSTRESTGGWGEIVEAIRNTVSLYVRRCVEVAWVAVAVPLIAGPWVLVVYVPWAYERAVLAADRWFGFDDAERVDRRSMLALGATVALALAFLPDELLGWWPFAWQRSHADWLWLRMHPLWLLLRAVAIVAPWRSWREVWYLDQRQRQEVIAPTFSGVAYTTPAPHLVDVPGVFNPHRNPEPPPIVQIQPTRITPLRVAANARPIRTIELPFGSAVEVDRLVAMLEADEGFSWRTWRRHEWTRGDWESACQILAHAGIISEPQSGKTTERLVSVDEAVQRIEDMG